MRARYVVLALLVLLSVITYMDRVCIAVAGPAMQADLGISPDRWGWILGVFALSYGLFEIPSGAWGDWRGQRRVLTRIVLWWSAFTVLTGVATSYFALLVTRFLFGMGEAGAYPNASGCIARWFPAVERARAQGFVWGASRVGGAITPFVVVPLMAAFGWQMSFYLFGILGVVWAIAWYRWYRDWPSDHAAVSAAELQEIGPAGKAAGHAAVPWGRLAASPQLWLIMAMYWFYVWGSMFFLTWFPEYLTKGRGLSNAKLWLTIFTALPFVMGAIGNFTGGFLSDRLTRRHGPRVGRVWLGSACLALTGLALLATAHIPGQASAVILLAAAFGIMDCMLPCAWAICLDVGQKHAGAVTGAMNSAGQAGGYICTVLFGYLLKWYDSYEVPLVVIGTMVLISAALFWLIDPARPLVPAEPAALPKEQPACV
jgi:ACS family glucarate transporter-like MFS transporter